MDVMFEKGAVIASGKLFEAAKYNVSNYTLSACFNGSGGIEYYSVANGATVSFPIRFMNLSYNGKIQDVLLEKRVTMIGRKQTCEIDFGAAALIIEQFLSERDCVIYTSYAFYSDNPNDTLEIGLFGNIFPKCFAADCDTGNCPDNEAVYFRLDADRPKARTVIFCGEESHEDYFAKFDAVYQAVKEEIASVEIPEGLIETEAALYCSAYWCALENYKEKGDYKAFMAGCRYLSPMRSYYRDSYYTVLSMYNGNLDKVRNQITVLARGIGEDGSCPSAVKSDWTDWWGDHYDSPSFLAMMLYDYIHYSGDLSLAEQKIGTETVFEKTIKAIEHLSGYADDTGLLYKAGRYNKRDWADEVNRYGYVTYDELLYARALYCIARIYQLKNDGEQYESWTRRFERVKAAINEMLWDEEKGYYVNFVNEDYTEDNLSIDTVFAAIFDIADEQRAGKMLRSMEQMLESKNHENLENFGSMCVYPFYKRLDSARNKSTQCLNYHNGANWPYLSAMYAYAKRKFGMEYKYLLALPFEYNLKKGNYTPIEYFSPYCEDGSMLQAWSGVAAFVLDEKTSADFFG
ncbi:MAG: amylo-alpha-1,6-glucosidase [Acutalibacteraceae bacterium]